MPPRVIMTKALEKALNALCQAFGLQYMIVRGRIILSPRGE